MLQSFGIEALCDIRTVPKSRRNPQFSEDALREALTLLGIEYLQYKDLGGLRHPRKDSPNNAWQNDSFRGYADYMQTEAFGKAVDRLFEEANNKRTAIMCAEAVPWRCHRSLVGDALLARGVNVLDIMSKGRAQPHKLTPWAKVDGITVTYPGLTAD